MFCLLLETSKGYIDHSPLSSPDDEDDDDGYLAKAAAKTTFTKLGKPAVINNSIHWIDRSAQRSVSTEPQPSMDGSMDRSILFRPLHKNEWNLDDCKLLLLLFHFLSLKLEDIFYLARLSTIISNCIHRS